MKRILVLGAGKIGSTIAQLLGELKELDLKVADRDRETLDLVCEGCTTSEVDVENADALASAMRGSEVVVSALPYYLNVRVAEKAAELGLHYFDLTEDVATSHRVMEIAEAANTLFMPQCGLAPGFISVVAANLIKSFDSLKSVKLRVGALPIYPTNRLNYNLTWSTDGLINEYCNPCDAIHEGRRHQALPLEGLESFSLDGVEYEAFNTSGGLGTLCDTFADRVEELNYKTVRYPGHCELMKLLCLDLELGKRRGLLKNVLETSVPATMQDVVMTFVTVTGMRQNRLTQESFLNKVYWQPLMGVERSAIQITTAAGVCAMVDLLLKGEIPDRGFLRQEKVDLNLFLSSNFGRFFR